MEISFIIPYHPKRKDNLLQTLRFLEDREHQLIREAELVTICNTVDEPPETRFAAKQHFNLNLDSYSRTKMLNFGVKACVGKRIALLDSDRILPKGYFKDLVYWLPHNYVVAPERLYNLPQKYTDDELERGEIVRYPDFRSTSNAMRRKNLFAGNTVMWKEDYEKIGGFDESYQGYGFADTDMTKAAAVVGLKAFYGLGEEWHLWHEKEILWDGKIIDNKEFKILTALNGLRYCKKWGIEPEAGLLKIIEELETSNPDLKKLWEQKNKMFL